MEGILIILTLELSKLSPSKNRSHLGGNCAARNYDVLYFFSKGILGFGLSLVPLLNSDLQDEWSLQIRTVTHSSSTPQEC